MSDAAIIGLGCATPRDRATQEQTLRFAREVTGLTGEWERFAETIYRHSGIEARGSALLGSTREADLPLDQSFFERRDGADDRGPSTAKRMMAYARLAPALGTTAAERALGAARRVLGDAPGARVTHLVTVSCTGFGAPGIDLDLIHALGLPAGVQRLHVGFMGCHGGVSGLRAAAALAGTGTPETPAVVLLVCVELCSLHLQYSPGSDEIVSNSLFSDGAAAVVLTRSSGTGPETRVRSFGSCLLQGSADAMTWTIGDHGFRMTLGKSVPELIRAELGAWADGWLRSVGSSLERARAEGHWLVHPGGPKILRAVGEALVLSPRALDWSSGVLKDHGNMSSPTVFFVLERCVQRKASGGPLIMLAFGPGLTVEAALLEAADEARPAR